MPARKSRLLIVDDEPATRLLLTQIFTAMGHEVVCAEDGLDALHQMRHTMPDIILSDLNMPGMSGFEFLSVVRRRMPGIYVIASSGAYTGDAVPEGIAADAFYEKATGIASLLLMMRTAEAEEPVKSRHGMAPAPVWISLDKDHSPNYPQLSLSCPECLRVFAHVRVDLLGLFHKEECVYCRSTIHYAVVNILPKVSEHLYHAELDAQMATHRREPASADVQLRRA